LPASGAERPKTGTGRTFVSLGGELESSGTTLGRIIARPRSSYMYVSEHSGLVLRIAESACLSLARGIEAACHSAAP
jgi:hypothetical protein